MRWPAPKLGLSAKLAGGSAALHWRNSVMTGNFRNPQFYLPEERKTIQKPLAIVCEHSSGGDGMVPGRSVIEEADALRAACCRGSEPLQATPEEPIKAPDGHTASVFDIAAYLRAGQTMSVDLDALYRLWDAKRAVYALPSRRDFMFEDLVPWLGHLMLVDVIDGGRDFAYRVFGTRIAEFLGHDLTGKRLSTLPPQLQRGVRDEYCGVMAARRAHYVVGSPFLSRPFAIAARAILPLSHGDRAVDQLLIGFYHVTNRV